MSQADAVDDLDDPSLKPERRVSDAELDITPMIDIVFLLLAFFVVASNMDPQAVSDLPIATHGRPILVKNSVILIVMQEGENVTVLGGERGDKEFTDDEDQLPIEIEEYVRNTLDNNPGMDTVLIKGEKKVQNKYMQPVFAAAKMAAPEGFAIRAAIEERK